MVESTKELEQGWENFKLEDFGTTKKETAKIVKSAEPIPSKQKK
jgi:hypothetical protein